MSSCWMKRNLLGWNNWLFRQVGLGVVDRKIYLTGHIGYDQVKAAPLAKKFFEFLDECEYQYGKKREHAHHDVSYIINKVITWISAMNLGLRLPPGWKSLVDPKTGGTVYANSKDPKNKVLDEADWITKGVTQKEKPN